MGKYSTTPDTDILAEIDAALNEALQEASSRRRFTWWDTEVSPSLASGATDYTLPADVLRVLYLLDPDGKPLGARTRDRQVVDKKRIDSRGNLTYAIGPSTDASTQALKFYPAISKTGTYTLIYSRIPATLDETTDVPDLPTQFHGSYLYWRARSYLLEGEEERAALYENADRWAETAFRSMCLFDLTRLDDLTYEILALP
jgi:hypothetical protein